MQVFEHVIPSGSIDESISKYPLIFSCQSGCIRSYGWKIVDFQYGLASWYQASDKLKEQYGNALNLVNCLEWIMIVNISKEFSE